MPLNALRADVANLANSIIFGTCTTAAATANKIVVIDPPSDDVDGVLINGYPFNDLTDGLMFAVWFEHENAAADPYITFQLNDGTNSLYVGNIYCNAITRATEDELFSWSAGTLVIFTLITSNDPLIGNKCLMANWQNINATEENIPETIVKRDDLGDIYLHDIFGENFEATTSITSPLFIGDLEGTAAHALRDSDGKIIVNTYVPFTVDHQGASDFNTITTSGFHRVNNNLTNKPSNASEWGQLIVSRGGDTITQIYGDYSTGNLYTRSGNPSNVGGNGSWTSWKRLLTDTDTNNFVTLNTNQTITGTKTFNSTVFIDSTVPQKIKISHPNMTKGTKPSNALFNGIYFLDSSKNSNFPGGRMGVIEQQLNASNVNTFYMTAFNPVAGSNVVSKLTLTAGPNGTTSAEFTSNLYAPELIVTNPNGVRFTNGGSGNTSSFLFRNDGTDFYGLVCNSDSPGDNWITPSGGGNPLRINLATGYIYTTRLYGAVWNDYAEYREGDSIEPGYVMVETGYDTVRKSNKRMEAFAGVSSDTFGFAIGKTDEAKTPIAVSGRVLVYTLRPRDEYKPGDCVCAAEGGKVDIMTREEIQQYPDRIVGTVSAVPEYETWGQNNVPVNDRIWIKVK